MKKDPEKFVFILSIIGTILGVVVMFWLVVQLKNVCEEIEIGLTDIDNISTVVL